MVLCLKFSGFSRIQEHMKRLLFMALLGLTWSCKDGLIKDDDTLSLERTSYTGNQLRMDGYYYQKANSSLFSVYFLYSDGIILSAGGDFSDETEIDRYVEAEFLQNLSYRETKYNWGVFVIEGNSVRFERWYPSSGPPLKAYVRAGEIIDDTTFVISQSYRVVDGQKTEVRERDETYHFKEFSPKPDSTNGFVL